MASSDLTEYKYYIHKSLISIASSVDAVQSSLIVSVSSVNTVQSSLIASIDGVTDAIDSRLAVVDSIATSVDSLASNASLDTAVSAINVILGALKAIGA